MSLHELKEAEWLLLARAASDVVVEHLVENLDVQTSHVADVKAWCAVALPILAAWSKEHSRRSPATEKKLAELERLPTWLMELPSVEEMRHRHHGELHKDQRKRLFNAMISCSLFRLDPYRHTIRWEQLSAPYFPSEFLDECVRKQEAQLTTGDAVFAAFAADIRKFEDGIVIRDAWVDLRSTYPLMDRLLGLRCSAFVPLRARSGAMAAILMVSSPIRGSLDTKILSKVVDRCNPFNPMFELLWEREVNEGKRTLSRRIVGAGRAAGGIETASASQLCRQFEEIIPGCAVISGVIDGGVSFRATHTTIASDPKHEWLFMQTESELAAYGVKSRWTPFVDVLEDPLKERVVGQCGRWYLLASKKLQLEEQAPMRVFELLDDGIRDFFQKNYQEPRCHQALETLRGIGGKILNYAIFADNTLRQRIDADLRILFGRHDPSEIAGAFNEIHKLTQWLSNPKVRGTLMCLALKMDVPALMYADDLTGSYLDGFRVENTRGNGHSLTTLPHEPRSVIGRGSAGKTKRAAIREFDELQTRPVNRGKAGHIGRAARREFSDPLRFIAWCRALTALFSNKIHSTRTYEMAHFEHTRDGSPDFCLPSLLTQSKSKLTICPVSASGNHEDYTLTIQRWKHSIKSRWRLRSCLLPLSIVGWERSVMTRRIDLTIRQAPRERMLVCDVVNAHIPDSKRTWELFNEGSHTSKVAEVLKVVNDSAPGWLASMDSVIILPVPHTSGPIAKMTFDQWISGTGKRELLVAGSLRYGPAPNIPRSAAGIVVRRRWDDEPVLAATISLMRTAQRKLLAVRQERDTAAQQLIISQIRHDLAPRVMRARDHRRALWDEAEMLDAQRIDDLTEDVLLSEHVSDVLALDSVRDPPPVTAQDLVWYVHATVNEAVGRARRRLSPQAVRRADLRARISLPEAPQRESDDNPPLRILLENVLANALAAAQACDGHVTVRILANREGIVIENDGLPEHWSIAKERLNSNEPTNRGLRVIRAAADVLGVHIHLEEHLMEALLQQHSRVRACVHVQLMHGADRHLHERGIDG